MVRTSRSTNNNSAVRQVTSNRTLLSPSLRRQISAVILLLSVICAPVRGIAHSKEQEKRGLGIQPGPTPTPASVTLATPGDKPELILQTGHTRSANAVVFSPDNRWLASGGKDNVIKIGTSRMETFYERFTATQATLTPSPSAAMGNYWPRAVGTLMISEI
jgi:WD40 repeat protein